MITITIQVKGDDERENDVLDDIQEYIGLLNHKFPDMSIEVKSLDEGQ